MKKHNVLNYLGKDIWRIRARKLSRSKAAQLNIVRSFVLAVRGFIADKCQLRASALTFYTMLSIVPIMAMLFGIARGFGMENLLEERLLEEFPQNHEAVTHIINFSNALLENTKTKTVAGIGVVMLFCLVIKVLGHAESSFNDIWKVTQSRSLARKLSDYLSLMLICPVLLILSGSMTVFITAFLKDISMKYSGGAYIMIFFFTAVKVSAYVIPWILFTFIYIFMPNTKVNMKSGIVAGIIAGSFYQIIQWIYIKFQIGVSSHNAVYGTFAAMPLFLVWMQLSWLTVLFGAELCFALQNVEKYEFEPDFEKISYSGKKKASIAVAATIVKNFCQKKSPVSETEISLGLDIPPMFTREVLRNLENAKLICEIRTDSEGTSGFIPLIPPGDITLLKVIETLEDHGDNDIHVLKSESLARISESIAECRKLIEKSEFNLRLDKI